MKIIAAIDTKLIALVQECYLWLWDRFGVPVGYINFALWATLAAGSYPRHPVWTFIFLMFAALVAWSSVWLQSSRMKEFNEQVRKWQASKSRFAYMIFFIACTLSDTILRDVMGLVMDAAGGGIAYLWCVQVRDREPPQKRVFARGAA